MADYEIEVEVGPDASGFPGALRDELREAERRAPAVKVKVEADVPKGFGKAAQRDADRALRNLDAKIKLSPEVSRTFAREAKRVVREAMAGQDIEVPITAKVARGFRAQLQREITAATRAGTELTVEVKPKVGTGWKRDLQRSITEATTASPITVDVTPKLDRRGMALFTTGLERSLREAMAALRSSGAADISPRADTGRFAADLQAEVRTAMLAAAGDVKVGADTSGAARSIGGLGGLIKSVAAGAVVGLAALAVGIVGAFAGAVNATADFDQQLSDLQAVASLTGNELGVMREQALQAGADTAFSASEAAAAQTELAKAGATTAQILDGGLNASLSLASAGGLELAESATYVATGLNTFKLQAEDASHVADVLAAAANKSAADIPDIGQALGQVGLVADQFGISIDTTAGALALFAQNGLKGSDAGTSLKTALLALNPKSAEAAGLMKEIGFTAYDADGNFVGLAETAGRLQESLSGMTEEQRTAALQTIFGTDAIRAANLLYTAGEDGIDKWTASVNDSGFAAEVAATKLDNLKGDVEALKGSFETAFIEAGSGQTAPLRELVQSLIPIVNELGPAVADLLDPIGQLLTDLVPALGPFLDALLPAMESLAEILGPIALGFSELAVGALEGLLPLLDGLAPLVDVGVELADAYAPLLVIVGELGGEILRALVPAFEALAEPEVVDGLTDLAGSVADVLGGLASGLGAEAGDVLGTLATGAIELVDGLLPAVDLIGGALLDGLEQAGGAIGELLPDLIDMGVELVSELVPALVELVPLAVEFGEAVGETLLQALKLAMPFITLLAETLGVVAGFLNDHPALVQAVGIAYGVYLVTKLAAASKAFLILKADAITTSVQASGAAGKLGQLVGGLQNGIGNFARSALSSLASVAGPAGLGLLVYGIGNIVRSFQEAKRSAGEMTDDIRSALNSGDLTLAEQLADAAEARLAASTARVDEYNSRDYFGRFAGAAEGFALAAKGANGLLSDQAVYQSELGDAIGEVELALGNVDVVAATLGLSTDTVIGFVEALGVNPAELGYQGLLDLLGETELQLVDVKGAADDVTESLKRAAGIVSAPLEAAAAAQRDLQSVRDALKPTEEGAAPVSVIDASGAFDITAAGATDLIDQVTAARDSLLEYGTAQIAAGVNADTVRGQLADMAEGLISDVKPAFGGSYDAAADFARELGLSPGTIDQFMVSVQPLTEELRAGLGVTLAQNATQMRENNTLLDSTSAATQNLRLATTLATDALEINGASLDASTVAGASNKAIVDQLALATGAKIAANIADADTTKQAAEQAFFLREQLIAQVEAFGLTREEAKAYVDKLVEIPDEVKSSATFDKLTADADATALKNKLDGLDGRTVKINAEIFYDSKYDDNQTRRLAELAASADGRIVRRPLVSLVGEAGPEIILPLTRPDRMAELLGQLGQGEAAAVAAALGTTGAPGAAGGAGAATSATTGGTAGAAPTSGVTDFVTMAADAAAELAPSIEEATLPGLAAWDLAASAEFEAVTLAATTMTTTTAAALLVWATMTVPTSTLPALAIWRAAVGAELLALQSNATLTVATTAGQMATTWQGGLNTMLAAATVGGAGIVGALVAQLETGAGRLSTIASGYAKSLADALNPVLTAVGKPTLKLATGGLVGFARGGYVPGPDVRRDVVPAMLMPGEVVIKRASVERFGVDNLLALNEGRRPRGWEIPRYAEGGVVTGDLAGLNPELHRRLGMWSAAVGQAYNVGSGFRDPREQAVLYAKYLAGNGPVAAPPGSSMHNFGLASDGNHWRSKRPELFGLRFTVPSEAWHVEPVEARQWARAGDGGAGGYGTFAGLQPLPKVPTDKLGKGTLADVAAAAMGHTYDQALEWAQGVTFAQPGTIDTMGGGSAGAAQAAGWVRTAMGLAGVGPEWFQGLMTIARRESNYDPTAVNGWDSNAAKGTPSKGLMQMIDPTFRAHALPGLGGILDPVANVVAAIRYIISRYGGIGNVQQANPALPPKGYAEGGLVTAEGLSRLVMAERPHELARAMRDDRRQQAEAEAAWAAMGSGGAGAAAGPRLAVEGGVHMTVTPPNSHDPESYAAALGHRAIPLLAAVADRTT